MPNAKALRRQMIETCRHLDQIGFVPASSGNPSAQEIASIERFMARVGLSKR